MGWKVHHNHYCELSIVSSKLERSSDFICPSMTKSKFDIPRPIANSYYRDS